MYNLEQLNNNYIICPTNIRDEIFDEVNKSDKLYNISFMSIEEFYTSLTFKITNELLYYVMKQYNVTIDVANTYLTSLKDIFFINHSDNEKVLFLLQLKNELINDNYIKHTNILKYYNTKSFIVIGYSYIEKKYEKALNLINNKQIIKSTMFNKKLLIVLEFKTIEDEINYTYEQIIKLLNSNISINNIKITGVSQDYYFLLKKFSEMYKLPVTIEDERSLYSTNIGKQFLNAILDNTYVSYLEDLKEKNSVYYNLIINILNEFTFVNDYKEVYSILLNKFKTKYINDIYTNDIKVIPFNNLKINENDHIFLLGFNQGKFPNIKMDEDYLSDQIKQQLDLSTTVDLNKANKEVTYNKLLNINNLYLSYSLASSFSNLLPSSMISEYGMEVIENNDLEYTYSNIYNEYALTDKLDNYVKYNTKTNELYKLASNYDTSDYDSYDNRFKGLDKELLKQYLKNKVRLSYTSLDKYNKCKFAYYIDYILKLNIYEDTFYTCLGKVFHEVLSYAFNEDFDFEKQYQISKNKEFKNPSAKEEFLLIKLKDELKFIIDTINEQLNYINYDKLLTEEEVNVVINDNCRIEFKGIIDKVMYKEHEGTTYVALVDYKTGSIDPKINDAKYGLNLQLPIYVYLSKHLKLKEVCVTGFYYQTILQNTKKAENDEDLENKKQEYLKLKGYTVDMPDGLKFDSTESNSVIIKGLLKNKDGSFNRYSNILNSSQMRKLESLVETNIKKAGNSIINGDFEINPMMIDKDNKSCKYCKYSDLCFKTNKDLKKLSKAKDLSFLEEYE